MSKILDLMRGLRGDAANNNVTATNTPAADDNTKKVATTEFVQTGLALKAPLASPAFTGNPTAPTPALNDNDTSIATTAFLRNEFIGAGKRSADFIGYQVLPGGITFHWGFSDCQANGFAGITVTGPVGLRLIFATGNIGTPTGSNPHNIGVSLRDGFPNQVLLQNTDVINHGVSWFAISI